MPAVPVGGTSGNEPCVYAYYTQGTTTKKIGKINIAPFKRREEKVILVPVNGATAPSIGVLQTYLDSVYRQANVKFMVTEKTGFRFNLDTNNVAGLERAGSGINKYSAEMRMLRDKFASDTTYDKKANYIFVLSAFEGGGLDGFMVRGRSMGFVASGASKRTYAHELGHGAFGLEHTFPEIGQSLSNNLMDYGDSTHLTHKQCKDIAKRKFVFSWLDSEEDAENVNITDEVFGIRYFLDFPYNDNNLTSVSQGGFIQYVTPDGGIIKLPKTSRVNFLGYTIEGDLSNLMKNAIGTLMAFEVDGKIWKAHFNSFIDINGNKTARFLYYRTVVKDNNGQSTFSYQLESKNNTYQLASSSPYRVLIGVETRKCEITTFAIDYTPTSQTNYLTFNEIALTGLHKQTAGIVEMPNKYCQTTYISKNRELYDAETGNYLVRDGNIPNEKIAIWVVNTNTSGYTSSNPWSKATPLTYTIGAATSYKGVTGKLLRANHPLLNIGWKARDQVYKEDLLDMTTEFNALLLREIPIFVTHKVYFEQLGTDPAMRETLKASLWIELVGTNKPYDLKSTSRNNLSAIPPYAAVIIGQYSFFGGKLMFNDDYGNFSYGYWGKSYGYDYSTLRYGASWAQVFSTFSFDPKRDTYMVQTGFNSNTR